MSRAESRERGLRALKNLIDYAQEESAELELSLARNLLQAAALAVDEEIERQPRLRAVSSHPVLATLDGREVEDA